MKEGPEKPLNFSKPKDQKKFSTISSVDKEIKILDAQDEAEVLRQWMILDHVEPSTEEAAFYIKKLEKYRKLYRHVPLPQIADRLGIELPVLSSEYSDYLEPFVSDDETEELTTEDIINNIKSRNPGISKEDIDKIIKNIVMVCIQDKNRILHSEIADMLAREYLMDEQIIEKISEIESLEDAQYSNDESKSKDAQKEIYENLEPVLIFEIYLIIEFKTLIENDPNIDRDVLQEKLLGRLKKWKDRPGIYAEIEKAFTQHLDIFIEKRKTIENFRKYYEEDKDNAVTSVIRFTPSGSSKVLFGPYSVNIILENSDFEKYSEHPETTKDSVLGLHIPNTPFNIIRKSDSETQIKNTIHHENLHALEDLLKREGSFDLQNAYSQLLRLIRLKAPPVMVKSTSERVLRTFLEKIKNEILNSFHEDKENGELKKIFGDRIDKVDKTPHVFLSIILGYFLPYKKRYAELAKAAESNPEDNKKIIRKSEKAFFTKAQSGIKSYGKVLETLKNTKKREKNEEILYFLGILLPLHQYYRLEGIIKRLIEMEILE